MDGNTGCQLVLNVFQAKCCQLTALSTMARLLLFAMAKRFAQNRSHDGCSVVSFKVPIKLQPEQRCALSLVFDVATATRLQWTLTTFSLASTRVQKRPGMALALQLAHRV
jgi:hypothetical protein